MALALGAVFCAGAAAPETVTLKNGTVYMGRTASKLFKDHKCTFMVDSAIVVDSVKNVSASRVQKPLSSLSGELADWFRRHPERITTDRNGREQVVVYNLRAKDRSIPEDVVLLERGPKLLKYFIIAKYDETIPDSTVVSYAYALREPDAISGVIDEVVTTDERTIRGQIVYEGSLFGVLNSDDMVVEMLPYGKIKSTTKIPLFAEQPLVEQVPMVDEVRTNDGRTFRGLITQVVRKPGDKKPYYRLLVNGSNSEQTLYFADVDAIYENVNHDYNPLTDTHIEADSTIIVAGKELASVPYTSKAVTNDFQFSLTKLPEPMKAVDGMVKLEMCNVPGNQQIMLVPLTIPAPNKEGKYEFVCPAQTFVFNQMPGNTTISPYGNRNVSYTLAPGYYLVYRSADKKAFIINLAK